MIPEKRKVVVIGGGTFSHVRSHLALAAPAFGTTAREIAKLCVERFEECKTDLYLTKMALGGDSYPIDARRLVGLHTEGSWTHLDIVTDKDLEALLKSLVADLSVKVIFMNAAVCDFDGEIDEVKSGKYAERLHTSLGEQSMKLTPAQKLLSSIRKERKDILLVAFKTTTAATKKEQFDAGLSLLKKNSCNLVLANDIVTRVNMIITPEEAPYHVTNDRHDALKKLVDIAWYRSHMTFTRSTVVAGEPVPWDSPDVPSSLRTIVNHCIGKKAYKPFNGATVGHFACRIGETTFLTSIRKSDFNKLAENGLVRVETDGPDHVIAYGAKPSVGGQSQRIIFSEHEDYDCIVHFHCPIKEGSTVPVVSQREYECGSHQCGQNTSTGLATFSTKSGNISAVMLDNHGPNIVFHHSVYPQDVIDFIEENFDLSGKTGQAVLEESAEKRALLRKWHEKEEA